MLNCNWIKAAAVATAIVGLAQTPPARAQSSDDEQDALARDMSISQRPIFEVVQQIISQPGGAKLQVDAWLDKGNATYRIGDKLKLMVRPRQDAHIAIIDVGTSGRLTVLYPNNFQKDAVIRANNMLLIPEEKAAYNINVGGPDGSSHIYVFASRKTLTLPEIKDAIQATGSAPFATSSRTADEFARDLSIQAKPQPAAGSSQVDGLGAKLIRVRVLPAGNNAAVTAPSPTSGQIVPSPGTQVASKGGLTVRSDKPVYKVGERINISVLNAGRNDCRLSVLNINANGAVIQLFPNSGQKNNMLKPGQSLTIPAPQMQIKAELPAGIGGLIAVCSNKVTEPSSTATASGGFVAMGSVQTVSRDLLSAQESSENGADDQASGSYMVVE